jgi:hypothetical protein
MDDCEKPAPAEVSDESALAAPSTEVPLDLPRHLIFHSLLSGLCPAIPLPFLDDWALRFTCRRMVVAYLNDAGLSTHTEIVDYIVRGDPPPSKGCVKRLLLFPFKAIFWLILYPIKKILRKILVFLLIKDCVNQFSATLHHGFLLQVALSHERISAADVESVTPALRRVYESIELTCKEADTRPVNRLLTTIIAQSRKTLFAAARPLRAVLRREYRAEKVSPSADLPPADPPEFNAEAEELDDVLDELEDALEQNQTYFQLLQATFLTNLDNAATAAKEAEKASEPDNESSESAGTDAEA